MNDSMQVNLPVPQDAVVVDGPYEVRFGGVLFGVLTRLSGGLWEARRESSFVMLRSRADAVRWLFV